jgi:hypothetical protein
MKKNNVLKLASVLLVFGLLAGTISTVLAYGGGNGNGNSGSGAGTACYGNLCLNYSDDVVPGTLTEDEKSSLLFMVEEEKLAHDVYQFLGSKYDLAIFSNIAQSEQTHMDALLSVIDQYGLTSPVSGSAGVFTNSNLQALYTEMTAKGSQSLVDAILVGGAIEELDIRDLQSYLAANTNSSLSQVYTNLLNGSYNHLKAFASEYEMQTGTAYPPQYLDSAAFQAAITSAAAPASQGAAQGKGNGRNGR